MGFGPFSSESTASDSRLVATDQATVVRGNGKVLRAGAVDLSKAKVNTGLDIKGVKGNLTITNNNDSGASDLAGKFTDLLSKIYQPGASQPPPAVAPAPAPVTTTDTSTTDTTTTPSTKTKLWLSLGGLALAGFGLIYFLRKL